jgi:photosystem II stability/assembly factor-like uncharacterized protein
MRPILTLSLLIAGLLAGPLTLGRAGELRNFDDAALHAVQFVDAREGWAVGDEGVIWHTFDGGRHWERQSSGVRASLRSVHFPENNTSFGWIAGREELPGSAGSAGVVLYTRDGGVHWRRALLNTVPGLHRVHFIDSKTGYLAGEGSDAYPSGVFATADGGRSWQPVPGQRCPGWLAADFSGPGAGALVGSWNRLATLRGERVFATNMDTLGGRSLCDVQLRGGVGFAVGQGGLVLRSDGTGGSSWGYVRPSLGESVLAAWDFHAVGGAGQHWWVVGRPGSAALHSDDGGRNWKIVRTGQNLPLYGIHFSDEQHGWAVGALGVVIATADGGKSWQVQRRGGERTAVLAIHARGAGVPLDTVAVLGGQDGYLTAALRVTGPDLASAALDRASEGARLAGAVRQAGGAAGEMLWQFPLGSHLARADRPAILEDWTRRHGDRAAEELLRQMVLAVRMWRPDVVLTDHPDEAISGRAADSLIAEAVRVAFDRAADPAVFPEQVGVLSLQPWKAGKLYGQEPAAEIRGQKSEVRGQKSSPGAAPPGVVLDLTTLSPALQTTPRDFAADAIELLAEGPITLPTQRGFHLLAARLPDAARHHSLMDGVDLAPGGLARRMLPEPAETPPEMLRAIHQCANMRTLAETPATALTDPNRLLAALGPMLAGAPDDHAARALHAVASQFARQGQWHLAREAYLLLADRYPTHPLALDACRWLVRHNSSSEARRRHELGQFLVVQQLHLGVPAKDAPGGQATPPDQSPLLPAGYEKRKDNKSPISTAPGRPQAARPGVPLPKVTPTATEGVTQAYLFSRQADVRQWYQGSLEVESRLAAFGPLLVADPSIQFCLQAAKRAIGDGEAAQQWYKQFAGRQPDGPWRSAALAELWLADRSGPPPKPVLVCRFADTRPLLDGKLDDACWQSAQAVTLHDTADRGTAVKVSASGTGKEPADELAEKFPTVVRLAYDREFLYVALQCGHPPECHVDPVKRRGHDADLRSYDRVSLLLDLDRDYSTCYHLQVDQRGCVWEDCWGDRTWDPRWFVATHSEAGRWVVEAAIPMQTLTGDVVTRGKTWACNVVRVLPGRGVQAWSLPAEAPEESLRPEGMGLLMFREAPQVTPADLGPVQRVGAKKE